MIMVKKKVVCFDLDDTLEDLMHPWIDWLNKKYNLNIGFEEMNCWELEKVFTTLTREQIFEPLFYPEFWEMVKPKLDSPYWVKRFIDDGHDVYICTNTHYRTAAFKMDLALFRYMPFLSNRNLIITTNKQMIKCDYLIDDGVHNVVGDYKGLLVDMPSNRGFEHPNVQRIFTLEEAYNIISKDAEERV
jgi:5'(3')-deoxyribonucleotidase